MWSLHSLTPIGSFSHVLAQSSLAPYKFLVSITSSCWSSQGPLPSGGLDPFSTVFVTHPSHSICGEWWWMGHPCPYYLGTCDCRNLPNPAQSSPPAPRWLQAFVKPFQAFILSFWGQSCMWASHGFCYDTLNSRYLCGAPWWCLSLCPSFT